MKPLAAHNLPAPALLDLRGEFPGVPEGWAYLDAAATAQKPRAVVEAITRAYACLLYTCDAADDM
jgi:selenocysteine lyase/cysteine desulfurase